MCSALFIFVFDISRQIGTQQRFFVQTEQDTGCLPKSSPGKAIILDINRCFYSIRKKIVSLVKQLDTAQHNIHTKSNPIWI
mmetsp:Transcript_38386/g.80386  ORF Transcript_38386/g.80386 Transcript_38386/m.80386 type:complete len:81 (-) Transcript_38386:252-494(-)